MKEMLLYQISFCWTDLINQLCFVLVFELGLVLIYKKTTNVRTSRLLYGIVIEKQVKNDKTIKTTSPFLKKNLYWIYRIIVIIVMLSVLLFTAMIEIEQQQTAITYLSNEEYLSVEGYVEKFNPVDKGTRGTETFYIGEVFFEYSEHQRTPGYRKIYYDGGVIKENGQKLRIDYYLDNDQRPVILRILEIE